MPTEHRVVLTLARAAAKRFRHGVAPKA